MKKFWMALVALVGFTVPIGFSTSVVEAAPFCSIVIDRRPFPDQAATICTGGTGYVQTYLYCYTSPGNNMLLHKSLRYQKGSADLTFYTKCPNLRPYLGNADPIVW